jgi:hypothetical protein
MKYQVGTVAPYWFKTQVLRQKGLTSPQLYTFDNQLDNRQMDTDLKVHESKV